MSEPTSTASIEMTPSRQLAEIIATGDAEYLATFLQLLPPEDTAYTINNLGEEDRTRMLSLLSEVQPEFAADLLEHFVDEHAADMIEELEPGAAAAIVDEMDSDEQTDVLAEMAPGTAEAVLDRMDPEEAADVRHRLQYEPDTAGGLMITEFLRYRDDQDVDDVIHDLRSRAEEFNEFEVRYVYVVGQHNRLVGVIKLRNLILSPPGRRLIELQFSEPKSVHVDDSLHDLEDLFDRVDYSAVPVLDDQQRLVGIVQRAAVQEALHESAHDNMLKFGGIIGGEEVRAMPMASRTVRRMAFLLPNVVLSAVSVTVIMLYQPIIQRITLLAVLLPMVANLSGAAGNQSVAVSIRELALGLVKPRDWVRVCLKEVGIGLVNGLVIGALLGVITAGLGQWSINVGWISPEWQRYLIPLAVVVMSAYTFNSVFAVMLGGTIPLALRAVRVDPAMASAPILTTLTDMGSFLLTLTFAYILSSLWIGV